MDDERIKKINNVKNTIETGQIHSSTKKVINKYKDGELQDEDVVRYFENIMFVDLYTASIELLSYDDCLNSECREAIEDLIKYKIERLCQKKNLKPEVLYDITLACYTLREKNIEGLLSVFKDYCIKHSNIIPDVSKIVASNDIFSNYNKCCIYLFLLKMAYGVEDVLLGEEIKKIPSFQGIESEETLYKEFQGLVRGLYEEEKFVSLYELCRKLEEYDNRFDLLKLDVLLNITGKDLLIKTYNSFSFMGLNLYLKLSFGESFPSADILEQLLLLNTKESTYCVIMQCLNRIIAEKELNTEVKSCLFLIKTNGFSKDLFFNSFDIDGNELICRIINQKMKEAFQILCINKDKDKDDVFVFLDCLANYNVFNNNNLYVSYALEDYDLIKSDSIAEYECIMYVYQNEKEKLAYIVMNSYLRYYIDVVSFCRECKGFFEQYYFHGIAKPNSDLRFRTYNTKQRYRISSKIKYGHSKQNYIFKILEVGIDDSRIKADVVEMVSEKLFNESCGYIYQCLQNGETSRAKNYISYINRNRRNMFLDGEPLPCKEVEDEYQHIAQYFSKNDNILQNKSELLFIYRNSYVKMVVPINSVNDLFEGTIKLSGTVKYSKEKGFKIVPDFASSDIEFLVNEEILSKAFASYLYPLKTKPNKTERVYFYIEQEKLANNEKVCNVKKMYLNAYTKEIRDLKDILNFLYDDYIHEKGNQRGDMLFSYLKKYNYYIQADNEWFDQEWKDFIEQYMIKLNYSIEKFLKNPQKELGHVYFNGGQVDDNFIFAKIQNTLFDGKDMILKNMTNLKEYIDRESPYYVFALSRLKNIKKNKDKIMEIMHKSTIFQYLFDSLDDFVLAVSQADVQKVYKKTEFLISNSEEIYLKT